MGCRIISSQKGYGEKGAKILEHFGILLDSDKTMSLRSFFDLHVQYLKGAEET